MLCDDHQLVMDGLESMITDFDNYSIVAKACNGEEAIKILKSVTPDIILMDIDMPRLNGLEATSRIKESFPGVKVIILTMHGEPSLIKRLVEIGADGYLLKNTDREDFEAALNKVASGKTYFGSEITQALASGEPATTQGFSTARDTVALSRLSGRELEVLKGIVEGLSNREIAEKLFISPRTVDTHRTNLMKKIEVHNIAGLVRFAFNNGIIQE